MTCGEVFKIKRDGDGDGIAVQIPVPHGITEMLH